MELATISVKQLLAIDMVFHHKTFSLIDPFLLINCCEDGVNMADCDVVEDLLCRTTITTWGFSYI